MAFVGLTVENLNDSGAGSLRAALAEAATRSADDTVGITFDESLFGGTLFLQSRLVFDAEAKITLSGDMDGDESSDIVISGDSDLSGTVDETDSALFSVANGARVSIRSVRFEDAIAVGDQAADELAFVIVNEGTLSFLDSELVNLRAIGETDAAFAARSAATIANNGDLSLFDTTLDELLSVAGAGTDGGKGGDAVAGVLHVDGSVHLSLTGFTGQAAGGAGQGGGDGGDAVVGVLQLGGEVSSSRFGIGDGSVATGGLGDGTTDGAEALGVLGPDSDKATELQAGTAGDDELDLLFAGATPTLLGLSGNDRLSASFAGTLIGGNGDDILVLSGGEGGEGGSGGVADGGGGDDLFVILRPGVSVHGDVNGGEGSDTGLDTISFAEFQFDSVTFDMQLADNAESATQEAFAGFAVTAGGMDAVIGTRFDDTLFGMAGRSATLIGGAGDDILVARSNPGGDFGDGDVLRGGAGADSLTGSAARDELVGGGGGDSIFGAEGFDFIVGGGGKDVIDGGLKADEIRGGKGADSIVGGGGNDSISGANGKDRLDGGEAKDSLLGGGGKDVLDGGEAKDILFGGAGKDRFRFEQGDGKDRILDFKQNKDKIVFASGAESFEDLALRNKGDNVKIKYDGGAITVLDESKGDFSAGDFLFA